MTEVDGFTDDDYTIKLNYINSDRIHVERSDGLRSAFANGDELTFAEVKAAMAKAAEGFTGQSPDVSPAGVTDS